MKKYLGSKMTIFAAIVMPIFILAPVSFGVLLLLSIKISGTTVFLALMCFVCTVIWSIFMKDTANQLYSWGSFERESVRIMTGFSKSALVYEKCKSCGIGYYIHGVLNSKAGSKIYFIYFSYDIFDEPFRSKMNMWRPTKTRIKVQFSKKLYDYLLTVLPPKQLKMLTRDYRMYLEHRGR